MPFDLRFDLAPTEGIVRDDDSKPSPNAVFIRKLGMHQSEQANRSPMQQLIDAKSEIKVENGDGSADQSKLKQTTKDKRKYGIFLELLLLSEIRKVRCSICTF